MATPLSEEAIEQHLTDLNRGSEAPWRFEDGKLRKTFQFQDFVEAFAFMTRTALAAERLNHHPDWFNVYGTVRVALNTHDADGITGLDFELASAMESAANRAAGA